MNAEQTLALIKQHDGTKVKVVDVQPLDHYCRVTFEWSGIRVSKGVRLNSLVSDFHMALRMKAKEAERDIAVKLAHEAEMSDIR